MKILNLTKHQPTPEQVRDGLFNSPHTSVQDTISECQRFDTLEDVGEDGTHADAKAYTLAVVAHNAGAKYALVAGASFLIVPLCAYLRQRGITPVSSFSERIAEELPQPDGSVKLSYVFKHIAFVEIPA